MCMHQNMQTSLSRQSNVWWMSHVTKRLVYTSDNASALPFRGNVASLLGTFPTDSVCTKNATGLYVLLEYSSFMEWSNEKVLEFLKLFQSEPCLWDWRVKGHKNRAIQYNAWRRIKEALQLPVSVQDLKKKKESLMGYYRIHMNRYKKSLESADGTNEVYRTTWFAFEYMDSFLRPLYESNKNTSHTMDNSSDATMSEGSEDEEKPRIRAIKRSNSSLSSNQPSQQRFVKKKYTPEIILAEQQPDEDYNCMESITSRKLRDDCDEYDHFGLMIAAKLRKIDSSFDRESLMNTIQNLVFQSIKKSYTSSQL
ncbi:hypothetical protein K1T71_007654 [Dendrolimus kikuchii]|uniref:Uncharacterized protein n=1 Tax=Dendrolimus kikuchii TaxID=765133 RepID=A0ACC1CXW1_9NEOP|nr:hypothetical protein K1T71_007654 [Dendrolimus kikuchii]